MIDECEHGAVRRKCETCEAYERGRIDGIVQERTEVVAWLRSLSSWDALTCLQDFASAIERGEHSADGDVLAERDATVRQAERDRVLEIMTDWLRPGDYPGGRFGAELKKRDREQQAKALEEAADDAMNCCPHPTEDAPEAEVDAYGRCYASWLRRRAAAIREGRGTVGGIRRKEEAMTTTKKEDAVFDALAQSAAELSDEEVAAEYREDGEELSVVASRVRGILSAAVVEHQSRERDRLRRDRASQLSDLGAFRSRLPSSPVKRRQSSARNETSTVVVRNPTGQGEAYPTAGCRVSTPGYIMRETGISWEAWRAVWSVEGTLHIGPSRRTMDEAQADLPANAKLAQDRSAISGKTDPPRDEYSERLCEGAALYRAFLLKAQAVVAAPPDAIATVLQAVTETDSKMRRRFGRPYAEQLEARKPRRTVK